MNQTKNIVEAFLYSPIDSSKIQMTCFCGEELKLTGYGTGARSGNGEAECKNGHYMILAHKFVKKNELPRYCDSFKMIFSVTRYEDEICAYCNKQIGKNTEWQREVIDNFRAVHKNCHEEKVLEVIKEARKHTKNWYEISKILENEKLEFGMMSYSRHMYIRLIEKKIEELGNVLRVEEFE